MGNTIARADCANADGKEVCRERGEGFERALGVAVLA